MHGQPGVSGNERFAHNLIVQELSTMHPDEINTFVGGFGVVAYWKATQRVFLQNTHTLAFRADTDALPNGHRCGHDGHTAIMLHFAHLVDECQHRRVNLVLIFQPEEETGAGAKKIVDSALLQRYNVDYVFGLHNLPGYAMGRVVLNKGTFALASTGVIYHLQGRVTHASTPELGINPGLAVSKIIRRIEERPSFLRDDCKIATLVCCRIGEEAFGTSAGDADLMYTLRASNNEAMDSFVNFVDNVVFDESTKAGLQWSKTLREPFSATVNNADVVERVAEAMTQNDVVFEYKDYPFRWSEDFAEYLLKYEGAFFGIGSGENHLELHHPDYEFPDELIAPAAHVFEIIMNTFIK
ncbi:MAG: M20/M25/M40 family metallo-hydrolase [Bacteroidales bacterium]|nr:M20/M25/M40 family metallo-hydrolase [Bacteroidales bacterium]